MNDQDRKAALGREAAEAREFAAWLEQASERADARGDSDLADRQHRRARGHRDDARRLEAEAAR